MKLFLLTALGLVGFLAIPAAGQSLWNPNQPPPSFIESTIAKRVGDVLTIVVRERHLLRNTEKTDFKKEADLDAALTNFDILPRAFNPLPAVAGNADREFKADTKYDKDGLLETSLSALVIEVLPNGNLLIEGRRKVIMDRETKTMRITGIVRPYDVSPLNTVSSNQIANASIAFEGMGALSRNVHRGWLGEILDYAWPF